MNEGITKLEMGILKTNLSRKDGNFILLDETAYQIMLEYLESEERYEDAIFWRDHKDEMLIKKKQHELD